MNLENWTLPQGEPKPPETPPGWPTTEEINKVLETQPIQEQILFKIGMAILGSVNAGGEMDKVDLLLEAASRALAPLGFGKGGLRTMLLGGLSLVNALCIMAKANGGRVFTQEIHHTVYGHVDIQAVEREEKPNAE